MMFLLGVTHFVSTQILTNLETQFVVIRGDGALLAGWPSWLTETKEAT